jgi:hypothetical protein
MTIVRHLPLNVAAFETMASSATPISRTTVGRKSKKRQASSGEEEEDDHDDDRVWSEADGATTTWAQFPDLIDEDEQFEILSRIEFDVKLNKMEFVSLDTCEGNTGTYLP